MDADSSTSSEAEVELQLQVTLRRLETEILCGTDRGVAHGLVKKAMYEADLIATDTTKLLEGHRLKDKHIAYLISDLRDLDPYPVY